MKIALVTGGSQGIGLACAKDLARHYRVYIAARDSAKLERACQQARSEGLDLIPLVMDVANYGSVQQGCQQIVETAGPIDVLVHAAGSSAFSVLASASDPEQWQGIIQTNLTGAYYAVREVLHSMKEGGRLVMISSVLGLRGMRNSHAYCASKHGLIGLVKSLACDLADRQITINAVCPGWVETEMGRQSMRQIAQHHQIPPELFMESEIQAVPIQRWIQSEEVAAMVSYLASEQAAAITGQAFEISGGL